MPSSCSGPSLANKQHQQEEDSRTCAARVLAEVFAGRSLTEALQLPCVSSSDAPFIQALCYGVLRQYPRYPLLLEKLLAKPLKPADSDIHALLQTALYQLEQMRVPSHAALNESVEATRRLGKKWAAGLVNALLRRYQREHEALQGQLTGRPEFVHALPDWLLGMLKKAWPDHWRAIAMASAQQAPLCLRINRQQIERKDYFQLLQEQGLTARPHPYAPDGVVLDRAVAVEQLPGFAAGLVSVQDAGAQLAALLLDPRPGERVLDVCAAPGGKSCHLLEVAGAGLELTAVDKDRDRLQRVEENLQRLNLKANCYAGDASAPAGGWTHPGYRKILLDAPCSATGVIRRHPDIKLLRRADDIPRLAKVQQACLRAMWPLLAPGGRLLYATCSILPRENEEQIGKFLADHEDAQEATIDAEWGLERHHGRQTLPGDDGMDGFYYALLEKRPA